MSIAEEAAAPYILAHVSIYLSVYICNYFAYFTYLTYLVRAQVDGKKVSTAEEAAAAILGDRGSTVHFLMQRDIEGKNLKFPLKLERDKPK